MLSPMSPQKALVSLLLGTPEEKGTGDEVAKTDVD